jgi:hypothetical protein
MKSLRDETLQAYVELMAERIREFQAVLEQQASFLDAQAEILDARDKSTKALLTILDARLAALEAGQGKP